MKGNMTTRFGFLTALILLGVGFIAPFRARVVSADELAIARASRPVSDDRAVANRIGAARMGRWVTDGQVPGKILFADDFSAGSFAANWEDSYSRKGDVRVVDDGRGGKCVEIAPRDKDFNCLTLKKDRYVPVDPSHPTAVLWETRASQGGNTPMLRVDYYDENKVSVRGEYQFRANVDPTQPTLFLRNAHLVTRTMPAKAKFLRLSFHHCPKDSDEFPGEIANVRVVDLSDEVAAERARFEPVRAERAAAAPGAVLVYADDNLTASYPVMPDSDAVPGRAGDVSRVRARRRLRHDELHLELDGPIGADRGDPVARDELPHEEAVPQRFVSPGVLQFVHVGGGAANMV